MAQTTISILAAISLFVQLADAKPIHPNAKSEGGTNDAVIKDVLVVHQNSQFCGKSDLYLSENAGRFVARNGDIIIASKAPDWGIVIFSRTKKVGCVMTAEESKKKSMGLVVGSIPMTHGTPRTSNVSLLGFKCVTIVSPVHGSGRSADSPIFQDRTTRILVDTTVEVASPCKVQPHLQDFQNWLYNLGSYTGVPLDSTTHFKDGSSEKTFSTSSIEHVSKPLAFFAYPTASPKSMTSCRSCWRLATTKRLRICGVPRLKKESEYCY
jgi:hypothetical protein